MDMANHRKCLIKDKISTESNLQNFPDRGSRTVYVCETSTASQIINPPLKKIRLVIYLSALHISIQFGEMLLFARWRPNK